MENTLAVITTTQESFNNLVVVENESFYEYYKLLRKALSDETIKTYMKGWRKFSDFLKVKGVLNQDDTIDPSKLNRNVILSYKLYLSNLYSNKNTARLYFAIVKAVFGFLAKDKRIPSNLADGIETFAEDRAETHIRQCLTTDEVKAVMQEIDTSTIKGARDYAILALCFTGAFRRVELYRANIEDLQTKGDVFGIYIQGKGRQSKRDFVIIPPKAQKALQHYLLLRGNTNTTDPLFVDIDNAHKGERLALVSFSRIAKERFKSAGIDSKKKTLHSTRHTAITTYLKETRDLAGSQRLARHLDPKTTMRYIHDIEEQTSKATRVIEEALF